MPNIGNHTLFSIMTTEPNASQRLGQVTHHLAALPVALEVSKIAA